MPPSRLSPQQRKIIQTICVLAIIASLLSFIPEGPRKARLDRMSFRALGWGMAEESARVLHERGDVVVVYPDASGTRFAVYEDQMKFFWNSIESHSGIHVVGREKVAGFFDHSPEPGSGMSPEHYKEIVQKYPKAAAIISFVGLPYLTEAQISELPEKLPKMVAYVARQGVRKEFFEDQIVHVVIARRFVKPDTKIQKIPELFAYYYQVIKPKIPDQP